MLSALDAEESKLDEAERKFVNTIREHGWFNTHILKSDGKPEFNFTTGFQVALGVPEIIVFGLQEQVAHGLLWNFYRDLKAGKRYETGRPYADFLEGFDVCFQVVDKSQYHDHMGWSRWFYAGDDFDCWQLIWPDKQGRLPWEADFNSNLLDLQPDLSAGHWGEKPELIMPNAFDRHEPDLPPGARDMLVTLRLHGWAFAPDDHHAYTTGLGWSVKAPEIVVCAQASHVARDLLAEAYRQISAGVKLTTGQPYDGFFEDQPVWFQCVEKRWYDQYLGWSVWFYGGHDFDCLQMIVPDSTGLMPWQPGFDPAESQPDLSAGNWAR